MNVIDKARQCGHNADVKYLSDEHAFDIAYEAYLKGHEDIKDLLSDVIASYNRILPTTHEKDESVKKAEEFLNRS